VTYKKLIEEIKYGDQKACKAFYLQSYKFMYGQALKYTLYKDCSKDVIQEAYIRIFSKLDSFIYESEKATINWMKRICTNEALNYIRKHSNWKKMAVDHRSGSILIQHDMDNIKLFDVLLKLPEQQRLCFTLFVIDGYSHKEIATQLGIKIAHSRVLLNRARNQLASLIEKKESNAETR